MRRRALMLALAAPPLTALAAPALGVQRGRVLSFPRDHAPTPTRAPSGGTPPAGSPHRARARRATASR